MKNLIFIYLFIVFISLSAFQCADDVACDDFQHIELGFDIEISSFGSIFSIGDMLTISGSFSDEIEHMDIEESFSISGESIFYFYDVFEVLPSNLNVKSTDDKVDIISEGMVNWQINPEIEKLVRIDCDENCSFEINFNLLEKGYYGVVFKRGNFSYIEDCISINFSGLKSNVNNMEILKEIGTETINFSDQSIPIEITPTNSFFFKVEE